MNQYLWNVGEDRMAVITLRTQRHVLCELIQVYFSKCTCLQNERYSPNGQMASEPHCYSFSLKDLKISQMVTDFRIFKILK